MLLTKKSKIMARILLAGALLSAGLALQVQALDTEVSVEFEDQAVEHDVKDAHGKIPDGAPKSKTDQGTLRIDKAFNLEFSKASTRSGSLNLKANGIAEDSTGKKLSPFVQVSDDRGGAPGWRVTVKLKDGGLKKVDDDKKMLGAELKIKMTHYRSEAGKTESVPLAPEAFTSSVDTNLTTLNDNDCLILGAKPGYGQGVTSVSFGDVLGDNEQTDGVILSIFDASKVEAGTYKGIAEWKISNVPA
ncbi:MAG: WxL domain-containing protein [Lactobacillales bacterium]|jgi:hypothetical protein|nr:WxL domain-containing protein [Lactobacillales bacterium]